MLKRTFAAAFLVVALALALPHYALATTALAPIGNPEVHWLSQNDTTTLPAPTPDHPEYFGPDVTMRISWKVPEGSTATTIGVGIFQSPFFLPGSDFEPPRPRLATERVYYLPPGTTSIDASITPILVWGLPYTMNITLVQYNETTSSPDTLVWDALVTDTPQPVFRPRLSGATLAWDQFNPVYWDQLAQVWRNIGNSGQGGPVGQLVVTTLQDGTAIAATTLDGTATSCPIPAMSAGHRYDFTVVRTFAGKSSPVAQVTTVIPVGTTTSIGGPNSVKHGKWFLISGRVLPTGTGNIRVARWLKKGTKWIPKGSTTVALSGSGWHLSWRTSTKGTWRFCAYFQPNGTSRGLASASGYKTVKVK